MMFRGGEEWNNVERGINAQQQQCGTHSLDGAKFLFHQHLFLDFSKPHARSRKIREI